MTATPLTRIARKITLVLFATQSLASAGFIAAAQLGGVPEPATWALMILGFGAVGGAMRRRNAKTSVRFA